MKKDEFALNEHLVFHDNHLFEKKLVRQFLETKKSIYVAFETIDKNFLNKLSERNVNILTLAPYMLKDD